MSSSEYKQLKKIIKTINPFNEKPYDTGTIYRAVGSIKT